MSLFELTERFPDEDAAREWWENLQWPNGRYCPHCGSLNTREVASRRPQPYRCRDCKSYFSVRTGTVLQNSNVSLRKWAFAVYLYASSNKGISSMQLHRLLHVTQKTAWFMLHRLREAWDDGRMGEFLGPAVEVDETWIGGKFKNMHGDKRQEARETPGNKKTLVVGARDRETSLVRAWVVENRDRPTLHGFIDSRISAGAVVYTDELAAYRSMPRIHESVNHEIGEYVNEDAHTNGIESFWAILKRAHKGTFHWLSPKHLQRYLDEFCWRHNHRDLDTIDQMANVVLGLVGRRLTYDELISGDDHLPLIPREHLIIRRRL